jgi:hypothetical protein
MVSVFALPQSPGTPTGSVVNLRCICLFARGLAYNSFRRGLFGDRLVNGRDRVRVTENW